MIGRLLLVLVYLLIGVFLAAVISRIDNTDNGLFLVIFFWPIVVACFIMLGVLYIPVKLGEFVGDLLRDILR